MMKVLFLNAPTTFPTNPLPPLGIGFLASILEEKGCHVKIIDLQVEKGPLEQRIVKFNPTLVGITSVTSTYPNAIAIASKIRSFWDCPIIMGGHHVSFQDVQALNSGVVDVVARSEAESIIWDLARALNGQIPLKMVKGISYKEHGTILRTSDAPLIENLDEIPWPARHLLPMEKYREINEFTHVIMSRGCPYSCLFCSCTQMARHTYRIRSPEDVFKEIIHIKETYHYKKISFFDDFFTYKRDTVLKLCSLLKDIDILWSCATRVDYVDFDLLEEMKNSGCVRIFVGAESGNQDILNKVAKGTTLDKIKEVASYTKKLGIDLIPSFVIGLPWDTEETIERTVEFSRALDVGGVWFLPMTPFPGTPLYDHAEEYGIRIVEDDFSRYTTRSIVATNRFLSIDTLKNLYLGALLKNPKVLTPEFM
jgi:anaerobic magnesium-protoporphyrin IX monomethyl ester cyclase